MHSTKEKIQNQSSLAEVGLAVGLAVGLLVGLELGVEVGDEEGVEEGDTHRPHFPQFSSIPMPKVRS